MSDSILTSVKKVLGLEADYTAFDLDIVMHINTALFTLNQLGVGPVNGLSIQDATTTWENLLGPDPRLSGAQSYVYLRVRLLFDPPATSYAISAITEQLKELEWRLEVGRTSVPPAASIADPVPMPGA